MDRQEIDNIFRTDKNGKFLHLEIPPVGEFSKIDLTGKAKMELSLDEVVRLKKYAYNLYSQCDNKSVTD